MSNKEMTLEWLVKNYLPDYESEYDKWLNGQKNSKIHRSLTFTGWVIMKLPEAMKNYTDTIRLDQHEKSCQAQKSVCTEEFQKIDSVNYQTTAGFYSHQFHAIYAAPLADFNDTITE